VKLRRAGLEKVLVGIESGSDLGLGRWQKRWLAGPSPLISARRF
jgi:hypothetical protein